MGTYSYSNRIELITPEKAREYMKGNTYNRPLSKACVDALADQMRRGQWKMNGEPIIFSGSGKLLDGQHRLAAVIRSGTSVEMAVARGVDEDAFVTIDTGKGRTAGDVFAIAGIKCYNNISAGIARFGMMCKGRNAFSGSSIYKTDCKITRRDLLEEYFRTPELYQEIGSISRKYYDAGHILRQSEIFAVMAYLIKVKNHPRHRVEEFFSELCLGTYSQCEAITIYRNMLIRDLSATSKMVAPVKSNLLAKTWNAYILHKTVKVLRWSENEGNIDFV